MAFTRSMEPWSALVTAGSEMASSTVLALLPISLHQSTAAEASLLVGSRVSASTSTLRVRRQLRNFLLSPMSMALLRQGSSSMMPSSISTGGTFSPPAVMMSSLIL